MDYEALLDQLPGDVHLAIRTICDAYFDMVRNEHPTQDDILEFVAFLEAFGDANGVTIEISRLEGEQRPNTDGLYNCVVQLYKNSNEKISDSTYENARRTYTARFGQLFCYRFNEGDLKRIQDLINSLRDMISSSDLLEADHKQRLLKRLERLQSELNKRMSDLDRFWGFIGDAGVLLGKFGENAKPFVDRIRELAQIVWHAQSQAEGLPSNLPNILIDGPKSDGEASDGEAKKLTHRSGKR